VGNSLKGPLAQLRNDKGRNFIGVFGGLDGAAFKLSAAGFAGSQVGLCQQACGEIGNAFPHCPGQPVGAIDHGQPPAPRREEQGRREVGSRDAFLIAGRIAPIGGL
jgi:hypothetical protein